LSRFNGEAHLVENRAIGLVAEANLVKFDLSLKRGAFRRAAIRHVALGIENFSNAFVSTAAFE
jgi:hypothetical protein